MWSQSQLATGHVLEADEERARLADGPARDPAVFFWLVRLRWLALCGVALVLLLSSAVLRGVPIGAVGRLFAVAAALLVYNAALSVLGPRRLPWLGHPALQIVVDCLALGALLHFAGGIENPFLPLFVLHVVTANITLDGRAASALVGLALLVVFGLGVGEATGALAHHCLRGPESCVVRGLDTHTLAVVGALGLAFVATAAFARALTARLRRSQGQLVQANTALQIEKTKLVDAHQAVESEHSKLQAIIDCMADAVVFSTSTGAVVLSNRQARHLAPLAGNPTGDLTAPPPLALVYDALVAGDLAPGQRTLEHEGRVYEATSALVRRADGVALGLVTVARDVTERREVQQRLMQEERMSVVGKLAAVVAHEVNNPIGVISLYSQHALAKLSADSPVRKHLETIRRSADGCKKIVGDLLSLARPRQPEHRPVEVRALCREVLDAVKPLALRAGVALVGDDSDDGPRPLAMGDVDQLRQALLNLALNAVEACEQDDRVAVRVTREPEGVIIEVADTGPGIAPEHQASVFQPFFTTKVSGTGLGLAVAENIVRSHGGRIELHSDSEGTTFRVVLPALPREAFA